MITEDQLQLITSAIDGELTAPEARRLERLLATSPEARAVHARLKADSNRLKNLPRVAPPANMTARVMDRIAALTPAPVRSPKAEPARPAPTRSRTLPAWVPAAVAACVLVGIAASSFWYFRNTDGSNNANRNPQGQPGLPGTGAHDWSKWLPNDSERPSAPPPRVHHNNEIVQHGPPLPPDIGPERTPVAPEPRYVQPDLVAFPPIVAPKFDHLLIRIPFLRSIAEFDRAENRVDLAEELGSNPAYRIDLFTRDPGRGVQVFQAAAKAAGVKVLADATTVDRLNKRQVNSVMIYTEALTAAEFAELIGQLSTADAKISPRVFDSLHAIPVTRVEEKTVMDLLGRDPGLYKRADIDKRLPRRDPNTSISDGTANHILDRVGSGGAGEGAKESDKLAVMVTWGPPTARTQPAVSVELKQFFQKRGDRKPNVVPVVIVIRPGNG